MSTQHGAVFAAAAVAAATSPYIAGLTLAAPERGNTRWWRPRRSSSTRLGSTAAVAVILAALGAVATGWSAAWPAYLMLSGTGAALVIIDVEHHRLPDRITGTAGVAGAVLFTAAAFVGHAWPRLGRAALVAVLVAAVFYCLALISPRGLGLGDVKLTGLLAGYLGWFSWHTVVVGIAGGLVLTSVIGVALMGLRLARRGTYLPLGPFLIPAAFAAAALYQ